MTRRSRIAALVALVALVGAGCANNDAKESDVVGAMEDAGLSAEQAECVGEGMQAEFGGNQALFNAVAGASDIDDLPGPGDDDVDADQYPEGTEPEVRRILDECLAGEGSGDSSGEGSGDGADEGDGGTTDATDAGDDATSTTGG